jgi:2-oxoglutarate dehydrogenase E1 component
MSSSAAQRLALAEARSHDLSSPALEADNAARLLASYRAYGYLHADVNPLQAERDRERVERPRDIDHAGRPGTASAIADAHQLEELLRRSYCGGVALNGGHVRNHAQLAWLYDRLESRPAGAAYETSRRLALYETLYSAEMFEGEVARRFPAQKRFSLEGCESYLVFLQEVLRSSAAAGLSKVMLAMPHRGRVNALCHVMGLGYERTLALCAGAPDPELATWDIKEHLGLTTVRGTDAGDIEVFLAHNPSHLEAVTPVLAGMARAVQDDGGPDASRTVVPVIVHGDASFSGQGIVTETFNLSRTRGYNVGGTIHVILNNQIGSTVSNRLDARSTLNCADVARAYDVPILHVNGDLPEAVAFAAETAVEFRRQFRCDILVDIVGYRRQGHYALDDPSLTQPAMQRAITARPTSAQLYRGALLGSSAIEEKALREVEQRAIDGLGREARAATSTSQPAEAQARPARSQVYANATTTVPFAHLRDMTSRLAIVPDRFSPHPEVLKLAEGWRTSASSDDKPVNWCLAETLAYGSLLTAGFNVRLTGLDIGRGSFYHRQSIWYDQDPAKAGEHTHIPLRQLSAEQGTFSVFDTPLSEEAVVGFEYGYSVMAKRSLIVWEAQFGDFVNNAQVIIDQFISSGEKKWGYRSGLVMMLPHGYDGGGPEHSSAFLGRFLALCAENNMTVAVPSTSAQLFHLLRRHAISRSDRPLVLFTPKPALYSMQEGHSTWNAFSAAGFQPVLGTLPGRGVKRLLVCSGKVAHDLGRALGSGQGSHAILRIEQLYPFPSEELRARLTQLGDLEEVVWVQEEARNHGAWAIVRDWLEESLSPGLRLRCVSRPAASASACCRRDEHLSQLEALLDEALS